MQPLVLQDPSVAGSPLDKRIAFLQSKNLTQEEIDAALARAGDSLAPEPSIGAQGNYGYPTQRVVRQPAAYGYGPYSAGPWSTPPEPPRRDWRDWFIMATVTSGVGYGLYLTAKVSCRCLSSISQCPWRISSMNLTSLLPALRSSPCIPSDLASAGI